MSYVVGVLSNPVVAAVLRIVGLALLAGAATTVATFVYRVRVRAKLPEGATLILGLGVVAVYLNTRLVFVQYVGGTGDPLSVDEAVINVTVFVVAGIAAYGGRYVGDALGTSDRISWRWLRPNVSPIVRAAGRFIAVKLPDGIDDIEGYDPVAEETKRSLEGLTLEFPRGLTLSELEAELAARLTETHDVGYVDADLAADGTVEYLAVGQRPAGIGPTLPPKSAAVAIRADPSFSASPGDTLQVWNTGEGGPERVGTAELRASAGEVATVVTDESVADRLDPTVDYRLMTLAADAHPDREFAAMLRRSDETMSVVEVDAASPLVGVSVNALAVTILAVRSSDGGIETVPDRERVVQPGDALFAMGRPDALRKLEHANGVHHVADDDARAAADAATAWNGDDGTEDGTRGAE
jgi:hypothetical protein